MFCFHSVTVTSTSEPGKSFFPCCGCCVTSFKQNVCKPVLPFTSHFTNECCCIPESQIESFGTALSRCFFSPKSSSEKRFYGGRRWGESCSRNAQKRAGLPEKACQFLQRKKAPYVSEWGINEVALGLLVRCVWEPGTRGSGAMHEADLDMPAGGS